MSPRRMWRVLAVTLRAPVVLRLLILYVISIPLYLGQGPDPIIVGELTVDWLCVIIADWVLFGATVLTLTWGRPPREVKKYCYTLWMKSWRLLCVACIVACIQAILITGVDYILGVLVERGAWPLPPSWWVHPLDAIGRLSTLVAFGLVTVVLLASPFFLSVMAITAIEAIEAGGDVRDVVDGCLFAVCFDAHELIVPSVGFSIVTVARVYIYIIFGYEGGVWAVLSSAALGGLADVLLWGWFTASPRSS